MYANGSYAGDVTPGDAYAALQARADAVLVDVRTRAEWVFVGVPDLTTLGKEIVFCPWQEFPAMTVNPAFADQVIGAGGESAPDRPFYFICRSGGRSAASAAALAARGFVACFNVAGGFEGDCDANGHRGTMNGWKADGLPWRQQ
ncbi:MAG: rhodanese-like domain-containing protein [Pseudomonadota bacterium]